MRCGGHKFKQWPSFDWPLLGRHQPAWTQAYAHSQVYFWICRCWTLCQLQWQPFSRSIADLQCSAVGTA